ncbi:hypothetical protein CR513_57794, partial [Mucuna pruriens]
MVNTKWKGHWSIREARPTYYIGPGSTRVGVGRVPLHTDRFLRRADRSLESNQLGDDFWSQSEHQNNYCKVHSHQCANLIQHHYRTTSLE